MSAAAEARAGRCKARAIEEFGNAGLGDARLDRRLIEIATDFMAAPQALVPGACGDWKNAKGAYRFLDNEKVDPDMILTPHAERTVERAREVPVVLAVSDTTMLDYTAHAYTIGLGPLSDENHQGMLVQPTLIVTPERVPLGVIDLHTWVRDWEDFGAGKETRRERSIEEKESVKWLRSLDVAEQFQATVGDGTQVVSVFDREGDIFDVLQAATAEGRPGDLLVRVRVDRRLDPTGVRLRQHLQEQPVVATLAVRKARQGDQEARTAELSIRFAEVSVKAPANRKAEEGRESIKVYAIWADEDHPPRSQDRISWLLLTTVRVRNAEDAARIVSWYACRWMIEILFKVLKSGCQVEERQLETYDRLRRCLAIDIVVAWQILYLTTVGRDTPDLPCTVIFDKADWQALWVFLHEGRKKLPKKTPTLREMTRMIGRLGGHLGRRQDGEPGVVTMWRGLQRLPDISRAWLLGRRHPE
jgi:hypothetical protein